MAGFKQTTNIEPLLRFLRKRSRDNEPPATVDEIMRALLASKESVETSLRQLIARNEVDYKELNTGKFSSGRAKQPKRVYFACYAADWSPDE